MRLRRVGKVGEKKQTKKEVRDEGKVEKENPETSLLFMGWFSPILWLTGQGDPRTHALEKKVEEGRSHDLQTVLAFPSEQKTVTEWLTVLWEF